MRKLSTGLVWGRKRRRLEALARLGAIAIPAKTAACMRCGTIAFEDTSRPLAVTGNIINAQLSHHARILLCGRCHLLLIELLYPDKVGSPVWNEYKRDLYVRWG